MNPFFILDIVIDARTASIGNGFDVKRIRPHRLRRMLGSLSSWTTPVPSAAPAPLSQMNVLPHPRIGLSTVSYLFDGQIAHRDSLGVQQVIRPDELPIFTETAI